MWIACRHWFFFAIFFNDLINLHKHISQGNKLYIDGHYINVHDTFWVSIFISVKNAFPFTSYLILIFLYFHPNQTFSLLLLKSLSILDVYRYDILLLVTSIKLIWKYFFVHKYFNVMHDFSLYNAYFWMTIFKWNINLKNNTPVN